jgi:hypothetical protein
MDRYGHMFPSQDAALAKALDERLRASLDQRLRASVDGATVTRIGDNRGQ